MKWNEKKRNEKERKPDIWINLCLRWVNMRVSVFSTRMQHVTPLDHYWPLSCLISPNTPLCSPSHTVSSPCPGPACALLFLLFLLLRDLYHFTRIVYKTRHIQFSCKCRLWNKVYLRMEYSLSLKRKRRRRKEEWSGKHAFWIKYASP